MIENLFKGIDITEQEKLEIRGGIAVRLFRLDNPAAHRQLVAA